jgi:hypothetical protein
MNKCNPFVSLAWTAIVVTALAGTASAEVGKKMSVTTGNAGLIAASPVFTDGATVAVPSSYKSKSNFLKVTTSYQASCGAGDSAKSKVDVGGVEMVDSSVPYESYDEDAGYQIVTKSYYLLPESQGGSAIAPDSMVTLKLTSTLGIGCSMNYATMVVEVAK